MRPTRAQLLGTAVRPTWDRSTVPRCSLHGCVHHKLGRCEIDESKTVAVTCESICGPAVASMALQIEMLVDKVRALELVMDD